MLSYDKEKNILYAYQNELARPNLQPEPLGKNVHNSYLRYINGQLKKDVQEIFMPALWKAIGANEGRISVKDGNIIVKNIYDNTVSKDKNKKSEDVQSERTDTPAGYVTVKFDMPKVVEDMARRDVTIMKLPIVHEDGTIEYEDSKYAFIHMLEQEPTISYEANENTRNPASLKIKNEVRSLWIDHNAGLLKIRFSDLKGTGANPSKIKYNLIDVIAAMADVEGYDIYEIFDEYANFFIINCFKDDDDKVVHLSQKGGNENSVNAIEYINEITTRLTLTRIKRDGTGDDSYTNASTEHIINKLLSLDRAEGEILAKDVYSQTNPGQLLAAAGTLIDSVLISVLKSHGVYKIYIKYVPDLTGYYLAEDIIRNSAPIGLKITEDLREYFPEEQDNMYLSQNYERMFPPIMFAKGETITGDMIETFVSLGIDSIKISKQKTGSAPITLNFYEEIITNRKVEGHLIGKDEGWYYLNKDGEYVQTNGAYTTYDFVALLSFCTKLFEGKWINHVINADIGFRKNLITLEEQYHRAFKHAVKEGFAQMNRKLKEIYQKSPEKYTDSDLIDNEFYPFTKYFWDYLRNISKALTTLSGDNVHNPVAYVSACTKVNVYVKNKHSVADSQRDIAIGSLGKIDPFEVPQSAKMGTVYNSTCDVLIDEDGTMKTPYRAVKSIGGVPRVLKGEPTYFTTAEEESAVIADICSLDMDKDGIVKNPNEIVLCKIPTANAIEKQTFASRRVSSIKYTTALATQQLSWATATIPFMNSNDAIRAVFAISQIKAAKGLLEPEEPLVMTSAYEQFAWLNNKFGFVAKHDGVVVEALNDMKNKQYSIHIKYDGIHNTVDEGEDYKFPFYFDSGYSVTKFNLLCKEGQRFKRGDVLVSSNFISDRGIMQLGRNGLVGFICTGYNYEDGSMISEGFSNALSSYRFNEEDFSGNPKTTISYDVRNRPTTKFIKPGEDTIDVSYSNNRQGIRTKRTLTLRKAYGFYEDALPIKKEHGRGYYGCTVRTVSVDKCKGGDKTSNRHGNKGVASTVDPKVISNGAMPRLKNGIPLDACLNPFGVGSRMNIGQVKEIHCGLIAHVLKIQISTDAYNCITEDEIRQLMSFTVDLMNSTGDPSVVYAQYPGMIDFFGPEFFNHCTANIKHIRNFNGCFNKNGTTKLMLPTNDGKFTETEVLIGYIYMFKLIQESYKKLHGRGNAITGEPYGEVTDAPTHGSSKGGGQAFGTMEMDALCGYGTSAYIQELSNQRCDNAIARDNMYTEIYLPPKLRDAYHIDRQGQKRSVTQFLYTMLALGIMPEATEGEFVNLSHTNGDDLSHWKLNALQRASFNYVKREDYDSTHVEEQSDVTTRNVSEHTENARKAIFG